MFYLVDGGGGLVTQLCLTLRDPMDCSPPGSCVHGILQARILKGGELPLPASGDLPDVGIEPEPLGSPTWLGGFFTTRVSWEASFHLVYRFQSLLPDARKSPDIPSYA